MDKSVLSHLEFERYPIVLQKTTRSEVLLSLKNLKACSEGNLSQYSSHARHVSIVSASYEEYTALVKSGNVVRQRMESAIETSDLKLLGDLYKRPRIVMRSVGTRLEGVVGAYSGGVM